MSHSYHSTVMSSLARWLCAFAGPRSGGIQLLQRITTKEGGE